MTENLTTKIVAASRSAEYFGSHMTMSGDYLAVRNGAFNDEALNNGNSRIDIFKRISGTWTKQLSLPNVGDDILAGTNSTSNISFGESLSMNGDYLAVSAAEEDRDVNDTDAFISNVGAVFMYKRDSGAETWSLYGSAKTGANPYRLKAATLVANDKFGRVVSLNGNYLAVASKTGVKKVWIFKNNGTSFQLQNATGGANSYITESSSGFGGAVSIYGDHLMVGAKTTGSNKGLVKAYKRNSGLETWSAVTMDDPADAGAGDRFGHAVSIYDNYAVISSYRDSDVATDAGSVYIYKYNGSDEWVEQTKLVASDDAVDDRFGHSVELNDNYALIGANFKDFDSLDKVGAAYIFKKDDGAETWTQQKKLLANDGDELERFGLDVQLNDDYALVAAPRNDSNQGAVYEFQMSELSSSAGVCFLGNTLVLTDQGKIPIKRITTDNTIDGYQVIKITKYKNMDNYMILIKKDSLGINIPSNDTYITREHGIYINNKLVRAKKLINKKTIIKEKRGHDLIYNILLKKHHKMNVNNMIVETLDPNHELVN